MSYTDIVQAGELMKYGIIQLVTTQPGHGPDLTREIDAKAYSWVGVRTNTDRSCPQVCIQYRNKDGGLDRPGQRQDCDVFRNQDGTYDIRPVSGWGKVRIPNGDLLQVLVSKIEAAERLAIAGHQTDRTSRRQM